MTPLDRAWLAGLLQGDGSFSYGGKGYPAIHLEMAEHELDVVERAAVLMGAKSVRRYNVRPSRRYANGKPTVRASVNGTKAAALMRELYPLLGRRRQQQIEEVLQRHEMLKRQSARLMPQTA